MCSKRRNEKAFENEPMQAAKIHAEEIMEIAGLYGADQQPTMLTGGQNTTWKAGDLILKPAAPTSGSLAELICEIPVTDALRLPKPLKSIQGHWVESGYVAWTYLQGETMRGRYEEKIVICDLFSAAFSGIARPNLLDQRKDAWAMADRVTWNEHDARYIPPFQKLINKVRRHLVAVDLREEIIHGDMAGNILFEESMPPAVIDITLYWRPINYAKALLIVDAVTWEGADPSIYNLVRYNAAMDQLTLRAALRRIIEQAEHNKTSDKDQKAALSEAKKYYKTLQTLGVC